MNDNAKISREMEFFYSITSVYNLMLKQVEYTAKGLNLNPTEFIVLKMVHHNGDLPLQELARRMMLTSGSITYVVDKLEKKLLISRRFNEDDRRVVYAKLTEAGRDLITTVFPDHNERLSKVISSLNKDEKDSMLMKCTKIVNGNS